MSLTSLLEKITRRQKERRITKWSDYRRLVASICDGKEPDADSIATILADNEMTRDDLRHDVQLLARRRKMRTDMDAIVPLEGEAKKLAKQIEDAEQAFAVATAKHEESMSPLFIRRNEIAAVRKRANQARMDLRQTCEDRELVAEYDEGIEQLNEAQHDLARLDEEITKRKSWASQDKEKAAATPFVQERKRYSSRVEEHERILVDLQTKADPAGDTVLTLRERLAGIEDRLLEP